MRVLVLFFLMLSMLTLKYLMGATGADPMPRAILAFGFMIFAGYIAGCYVVKIGLPSISGYLLAGIICGPELLNLVDHGTVLQFGIVEDLALALIAFTAGGEIKLSKFKKCALSILSISVLQAVLIFAIVMGGSYLAMYHINSFGLLTRDLIVVSIMLGAVAVACSPATTIAVIVGSRSKGRITDITIGVTVIKDVLVFLGFTMALAIAYAIKVGGTLKGGVIGEALIVIALSLIGGVAVSVVVGLYLKYIRREFVIFVVTVSLGIVFLSKLLGFHYLLSCLMAGFLVENFTSLGDRLVGAIERTSMAVYIIFFALAGAMIDFTAIRTMWPYALGIVFLRVLGTAVGTYAGASIGKEGRLLKRYGWMGFVSQAGVGLGLVVTVARVFPEWGATFRTVMIAAITINQLIGPITLKLLLNKASETSEKHLEEVIAPLVKKVQGIS
ncbi:MAG: cation:proton antiporter [Deltaproteobacteria bacterium]|jgi:Kef-type K+ transport system membrane component KefB|nr:cation:proton antiporter [Deltaproteobacteria bacterium]